MAKNKKDVVGQVQKIIEMHPTIRNDLNHGLINVRKLAKYIIKHYLTDASLDAVMSAIRRYDPKPTVLIFENAQKMISRASTISTRNPIASIDVKKDPIIHQFLPPLFLLINYQRGEILRIFQAEESIKILIDQKNLKKIKLIIPKNKIKKIIINLAEIHIKMDAQVIYTPGVVSVIVNALAINYINIMELMSCASESMWYIDEKDLAAAYQIIYQTIHPSFFKDRIPTVYSERSER